LFLNAVISFIVVGLVLFLVVKAYNKAESLRRGEGSTVEVEEESTEVILLRQIRDQLANTATIQLPRSQ
jgi:large-conductance mechanosensitive channel